MLLDFLISRKNWELSRDLDYLLLFLRDGEKSEIQKQRDNLTHVANGFKVRGERDELLRDTYPRVRIVLRHCTVCDNSIVICRSHAGSSLLHDTRCRQPACKQLHLRCLVSRRSGASRCEASFCYSVVTPLQVITQLLSIIK